VRKTRYEDSAPWVDDGRELTQWALDRARELRQAYGGTHSAAIIARVAKLRVPEQRESILAWLQADERPVPNWFKLGAKERKVVLIALERDLWLHSWPSVLREEAAHRDDDE
jgi:hypothetical protein